MKSKDGRHDIIFFSKFEAGGTYMNIKTANRLIELRKKHGYSQEELANALGLSRQSISKWERSEASPDTDNLIALAKLYNMSLDELLGMNEENYTQEDLDSSKDQSKEESPKETPSNETSEQLGEDSAESRVEDGENTFNYSYSGDGVNVKGGAHFTNIHVDKNGTKKSSVSIDGDGITINNKRYGYSQSVSFGKEGMTVSGNHYEYKDENVDIDDDDFDEEESSDSRKYRIYLKKTGKASRYKAIIGIVEGIMYLASIAVYLLLGFLIPDGSGWRWGWTIFFLVETLASLARAIVDRRFTTFNIVFAVLFAYLFPGMYMGLWHPTWVIFLAIPIYYSIFGPIDNAIWCARVKRWVNENQIDVEVKVE